MPTRSRYVQKPYLLRRPDLVFALCVGFTIALGLMARAVGLLPLS